MEIGLSLGANIGDRVASLMQAKQKIAAIPGVALVVQSALYETEPVEVSPEFQHLPFLNSILIIESLIPPAQLLNLFQFIEQQIGREPQPQPNQPRLVDIDIIYADQLQIDEPHLTIPHPRWAQRRFVLQPLCDVRPELILPGQSAMVKDLLAQLQDASRVALFQKKW